MTESKNSPDGKLRQCSRCQLYLPVENFYWKIKGKTRQSMCKPCRAEYFKEYYEINGEYVRERQKRYNRRVRRAAREQAEAEAAVSDLEAVESEFEQIYEKLSPIDYGEMEETHEPLG